MPPKRSGGLLQSHFYACMALPIVGVVIYGFSFTVEKNLFHPAVPRPWILYVHAAVFSAWLVFFALQSALVRLRKVRWHQRIGWFGVALGTAIITLGTSTAIVMARFNTFRLHSTDAATGLMIPLFDMVCFATTFALAVRWRRQPERHRRLMFIATCALTAAAFGRFPEWLLPSELFYAGVDALILFGVARDLIVSGSVHPVYRWALPAFIVGQTVVTYTVFHDLAYWRAIARLLVGTGPA